MLALVPPLGAQRAPAESPLAQKVVRPAVASGAGVGAEIGQLAEPAAAEARADLASLGVAEGDARVDLRTGRFSTLVLSLPLVPGTGANNSLTWSGAGASPPQTPANREAAIRQVFARYLDAHRQELRIDVAELGQSHITVSDGGELVQIQVGRRIEGIPVRDSFLTAVINHGNLVLLGASRWGDVDVSLVPSVSLEAASSSLASHLAPFTTSGSWRRPQLELVPMASDATVPATGVVGAGYDYRLVWRLSPLVAGDGGSWEALVDARDGRVVSFLDLNRYATPRSVTGGVLPASNDGTPPTGVEQGGYPMPFTEVAANGGLVVADGGGNLPVCVDGDASTELVGSFVGVQDLCGVIDESSAGDLDLGTSAGTDCAVPTGSSSGNTHSARTSYYAVNRVREIGASQLPGNPWLRSRLPLVTNFPADLLLGCNAVWDGSGILFTSSSPPDLSFPNGCSATGELPGVVAHEWAHGLDDNDANGELSNPAEGIADVFPALWLGDSCIARGFFEGVACSSPALADGLDECLSCDGVREIDWRQRANDSPHDISYIDTYCPLDLLGPGGPCLGSTHCEGHLVSEAAWDLAYHDLLDPPLSLEAGTAHELAARLFYRGSGLVGDWFTCVPGSGTGDGCNADSGYLNLLAVDDDNGDLGDGTPHMSAIHAAFARHGIACDAPDVQDGGCLGAPTGAPSITVDALDRGARVSWGAVAGATSYRVYRSEGVLGCAAGKALVGETGELELVDQGLLNGFDYHYSVVPVGASDSCVGPASVCTTVTPQTGPNLALDSESASLSFLSGDGDEVIDNCESAQVTFDVHDIGATTLTNVTITAVEVVSHPGSIQITSPVPVLLAATLDPCEVVQGAFTFTADGLSFDDVVEIRVHLTADEMDVEHVRSLRFGSAETDFVPMPSATFDFESDLDGWQVTHGSFSRTSSGGGAGASSFYLASSNNLPNQCDEIRSPLMRLQPTSTLAVWSQFDIEPALFLEGLVFWFDRANVGVVDAATGVRTPVDPDGGRLYNAGGTDGTCVTAGQNGWADSQPSWGESTWSASALGASAFAGRTVHLDVGFGTDDGNWDGQSRYGLHFDRVTVTDLDLLVADAQSDVCDAPPVCDLDGVCEPGEQCLDCADCPYELVPECGNGVCEPGLGEDCLTCASDCAGQQSGKPSNLFCCGAGGGRNPVGCADARCTANPFACGTAEPMLLYCCGDAACDAGEDSCGCALDCGDPAPGEVQDLTCQDSADNDCDGFVDCSDSDCSGDIACGPSACGDGTCAVGEDCETCPEDCSGVRKGRPSRRYCCGDGVAQPGEGDGSLCDGNY